MATPAKGSATLLYVAQEADYGVAPTSGWVSFSSTNLPIGENQGILAPDLIGQGRGAQDPEFDVIEVTGSITLPIGLSECGYWFTFALGPSTVVANSESGWFDHTWVSGKETLPSFSILAKFPDITGNEEALMTGLQVDTMTVSFDPTGRAYLELGVIGKSARRAINTDIGIPATLGDLNRFSQEMSFVEIDNVPLGKVTNVNWPFLNNSEQLRYVGGLGLIGDVLPGLEQLEGQIDCLLHPELESIHEIFSKADDKTEFELEIGFRIPGSPGSTSLLTFRQRRVTLARPAYNIDGPGGIQVGFPFSARDDGTNGTTKIILANQVASYPS